MPVREIMGGIAVGTILYFIYQGADVLPILFIMILAGTLIYANILKTGGKSFAVASRANNANSVVKLEDVGGQDVAKNELKEALDFIRNTESLKQLGIRPLKGILLSGPPGTGKTLLAKAAAHYTDSVYVAASGSEFVEMYVGVGAQRIRQLFNQARQLAKKQGKTNAVIFIDEIDVLGSKRGQSANHLEHEQTLNELLVQMDGISIDDSVKILIIAATNRSDMLDPALLRPGRFDRQVKVDLPDKNGRLHILKLHTRNKPLSDDVCLEEIAQDTMGFSGAHLESLTNEAAILALRENEQKISNRHLRNAIDKVIMGEKLDRLPTSAEKKRIAIHEAGHALISELKLPGSVASVNVVSRSNALGYVRQTQTEEIYLLTLEALQNKIAVALAGAVAEEIMLGNRSTGAANDFKLAGDLTKRIITSGLSELGIIDPDSLPKTLMHSTLSKIITEIERHVYEILQDNRQLLQQIVDILIDKEYLNGTELRTIIANTKCA